MVCDLCLQILHEQLTFNDITLRNALIIDNRFFASHCRAYPCKSRPISDSLRTLLLLGTNDVPSPQGMTETFSPSVLRIQRGYL